MTIDEIILKEKEIAEEFQRMFDTHMLSEDMSLEEMYCDDTEVINEKLERIKNLEDYHNTIVKTMEKYRKIQEIYDRYKKDGNYYHYMAWFDVVEVIEDGNLRN